jgi:hypothetical protein
MYMCTPGLDAAALDVAFQVAGPVGELEGTKGLDGKGFARFLEVTTSPEARMLRAPRHVQAAFAGSVCSVFQEAMFEMMEKASLEATRKFQERLATWRTHSSLGERAEARAQKAEITAAEAERSAAAAAQKEIQEHEC